MSRKIGTTVLDGRIRTREEAAAAVGDSPAAEAGVGPGAAAEEEEGRTRTEVVIIRISNRAAEGITRGITITTTTPIEEEDVAAEEAGPLTPTTTMAPLALESGPDFFSFVDRISLMLVWVVVNPFFFFFSC